MLEVEGTSWKCHYTFKAFLGMEGVLTFGH